MHIIEANIDAALAYINLRSELFYKCDENTAQYVLTRTKDLYVDGAPSVWWFSLKHQVAIQHFEDGGFRHLLKYVPQKEATCWFIPELHEEYPLVYKTQASCVIDVLGNTSAFDYYLVEENFNWLIAETDADQLIKAALPST